MVAVIIVDFCLAVLVMENSFIFESSHGACEIAQAFSNCFLRNSEIFSERGGERGVFLIMFSGNLKIGFEVFFCGDFLACDFCCDFFATFVVFVVDENSFLRDFFYEIFESLIV